MGFLVGRPHPKVTIEMVSRNAEQKKCVAFALIVMLLVFLANLNGNVGVYFMEKYENAGTGGLTVNNTQPHAVHIAYGDNPQQGMVVVWGSEAYSRSTVLYGRASSGQLNYQVTPSYRKIVFTNEFGLRYWYRAELKGLEPDTQYFYSIRTRTHSTPPKFTFRTATYKKPPEFLVFGDLGLQSMSFNAIMKEGLRGQYDALLHLGDIAYNLFSLKGITGDNYLRNTESTTARVPYLMTPGDHEGDDHFYHYRYRFSMPGVPWPMPEEKLWYSIDIGNVHLVSYNTETYFHSIANIGRQFLWLVDDLHSASKNRHVIPWIVVMGHKPLYCSQLYPQDCNAPHSKLRMGVEELFYTFGVDLVLQGHCHSYERTWPLYRGKVVARHYNNVAAPVYITHGTSGNQYITDTINTKREWSAHLMSTIEKESFGRLKILNDSHLMWTTTLTSTLQVVDSFVLTKDKHGPNADIESFIRRARSNQTLDQLLLGQNLSVAKGDLVSGWIPAVTLMLAFALVVLLFLFRMTVVDFMETEFHRASYFYRKLTGRQKTATKCKSSLLAV